MIEAAWRESRDLGQTRGRKKLRSAQPVLRSDKWNKERVIFNSAGNADHLQVEPYNWALI